jgi:hypothetical protein
MVDPEILLQVKATLEWGGGKSLIAALFSQTFSTRRNSLKFQLFNFDPPGTNWDKKNGLQNL